MNSHSDIKQLGACAKRKGRDVLSRFVKGKLGGTKGVQAKFTLQPNPCANL